MSRDELLNLLWERAAPQVFVSKEQFLAGLDGWEIVGHEIGGELGWITCQNGPEFHFQSVGRTRLLPPRMIRDFLRSIIAQHGHALTRTPEIDRRQHRFNLAFGFKPVSQDEHGYTIYRIESLPMLKGNC